MTCIAGLVTPDTVWMGGDSLSSNYRLDATSNVAEKVFQVGPFLFGLCGSPRVQQVLRYHLRLDDDPRKDPHEFICTDFADHFREILERHGSKLVIEKSLDLVPGYSELLVGFRGRLFVVQSNFQVLERTQGFDAVGCGGSYALASLWQTASTEMKPEERIYAALHCAETFSAGVRRPFHAIALTFSTRKKGKKAT